MFFQNLSPTKKYAGELNSMKKTIGAVLGFMIGLINIIAGSCGGIAAVESLKLEKIDKTKSHATAVAVILPLTTVSAAMYLMKGNVKASDSLIYLLPGLLGSALGAFLLPKVPKKILAKTFSLFIIYAGIRMMLK